jgi:hypothetical protein
MTVQKQGHFTCPNCGTEAWVWSKKDPEFAEQLKQPAMRTCPDCLAMNRTHPDSPLEASLSQVWADNTYVVCQRCEGVGVILRD